MKTLFLNNWLAKIVSILLATVLWFLIKKNVEQTTTSSTRSTIHAPEKR